MSGENFKTCRYCAEQIRATAKVCPRCRQWLSIFSLNNPAGLLVVFCLGWAFFLAGCFFYFHKMVSPGMDFSPYRGQISIIESHMYFETNHYNVPYVYVVAVVTNQTDKAWNEVEIQARYFNKKGTLIDVGRGGYFSTLYPGMDGAIHVDAGNLHPMTDYNSYKLYIGSAHDAHSRF